MRRGSTILIVVGILLALGTAAIAYVVLSRGPAQQPIPPTATPETMVDVVIALQNIPAYTEIPAEAVGTGKIAQSKLTTHLQVPEAVIGRWTGRTILQSSPILAEWIIDPATAAQEGKNASLNITPDDEGRNRVAMAYQTDELLGVAGAIQNGDFLDILISYHFIDREEELEPVVEGAEPPAPTKILVAQLSLQDIEVYRVGPWLIPTPTPVPSPEGEAPPAEEPPEEEPAQPVRSNILTLLLTQQDALVLKFARESGATIDLVLRARDDHTEVRTETVTMQYITTRFEITVPTEPMRFLPVTP
jgi:Flp pilus assembly protein CpaB